MKQTAALLIVDDDPNAQATLEAMLLPEGYALYFAASGQETLKRMAEQLPDLVLLDVMMPGMDGFEICRQIKADKRWCMIPVIIVTALDSQNYLLKGLEAGADDFLSKPVGMTEVQVRVRSLLRIKHQYDELQTLLRQRESLVNMLVHDLRQPLTLIMVANAMLLRRLTGAAELRYVQEAQLEARRLNALIDQILVVARTRTHQLELDCVPVNVAQLVQEACTAHTLLAEAREIRLLVDLPDVAPRASLDRSMMQRVLDNLISNGLKFAPSGSTLTIQVKIAACEGADSACIQLRVADEGPGIPPEHAAHIFDLYEIVNLYKEGVPQFGLGLPFCKLVIEAQGGRIFTVPNLPHGSVFVVELQAMP